MDNVPYLEELLSLGADAASTVALQSRARGHVRGSRCRVVGVGDGVAGQDTEAETLS